MARADAERFHPDTVEQWRDWLAAHHGRSDGVWLVTWRRGSGRAALVYEEAVCEALAYGWIDGQAKTLDERRSMQWFTLRNPASGWSRYNKERVARLESQGRMQPAGRAAVEHAKATGRWTVCDDADALIEPAALARALDATPQARSHWESFPPSTRRQALGEIALAKRAETKARRIATIVERAGRGQRPV